MAVKVIKIDESPDQFVRVTYCYQCGATLQYHEEDVKNHFRMTVWQSPQIYEQTYDSIVCNNCKREVVIN